MKMRFQQLFRSEWNHMCSFTNSRVSFLYFRCCLSDIHVIQTKDVIVACKNMLYSHTNVEEHEQLSLHLQTLTEAFRFLRNCCAETPKNQNIIL